MYDRNWVAFAQSVQRLWRGARQMARLMIGVPDYDTYVAHCRLHHPERPPMTREAFFRNRLEARYGGNGRIGCC
jgi:uncharacterized short protein YbdD (DUF466 family)